MNLFGKSKKCNHDSDAVGTMKQTLETLEKREQHLQKKIERELNFAKSNSSTNRNAALMAIKRKKGYDSQLIKLNGARFSIEQQLMVLEEAQVNKEIFETLSSGSKAISQVNDKMTVEDVDEVMDNVREQFDVANEISEAISQPLGEGFDEDDLEAELNLLNDSGEEVIDFPSIPDNIREKENEELKQLEISLEM
eukprot:TRINITY_DN443_c0_g1_i1.p1 TRINITY_DN443_c0_g1~~TRINITY_DN443_c0_g1_i1.p1  ORF type:complete len:195 (+),score=48.28 TRINITY_DN443_c0_g1_i1:71-655(+)